MIFCSKMGDLIALLLVDHFAIGQFISSGSSIKPAKLESIIHFKTQCHMEIEENVVFPVIESTLPEDKGIHETIKKALSDHIMIRRAGKSLIDLMSSEENDSAMSKAADFLQMLARHDMHEDQNIFPSWFHVDTRRKLESLREARTIIEQYGYRYYQKATDLPEYMTRYFLS